MFVNQIYSKISDGIHNLSEEECQIIFPILKCALEEILIQKLAKQGKESAEIYRQQGREDLYEQEMGQVVVLEEFTTSEKYKKEIYPTLKDKYKNVVNTEIPKYVLKQLEEAINKNPDIIIIDRSLFDRVIWVDRLFLKGGMSKAEYSEYKNLYIPLIKEKIDIVISTYTDSVTALKRDYNANLSLEKRNFLNETNINEYNKSLLNMKELSKKEKINFKLFDTTNKNQREISFEVIDFILEDMKKSFLKKAKKEFN